MADITNVERKPAPDVVVNIKEADQRSAIRKAHMSANPNYSYAYERPNVTDGELAQKGWEKVLDGKGAFVHHGGDPLVRKLKAKRDEDRALESQQSLNQVKSKLDKAYKAGKLTQVASKKTLTNPTKE